ARALVDADEATGADFIAWLNETARRQGRKPRAADVKARAFALRCLIGGLAIRAVREPEVDRAQLEDGLRLVLPQLLSFPD
ncbi:MAG TPA: hypothetical protein VFZ51_10510, partial [Woeseiaceae bacterium]